MKADLHVHSAASHDGRESLERLARAARDRGLDAVAVCDHNLCTPVPAQLWGVKLIPGTEISTREGHILGLFLERPVDYDALRAQGLPGGAAAVEAIHAAGGVAVLAHPFQRPGASEEDFLALGADLIEGANARADMKAPEANRRALELARRLGLGATGGSDAHGADEVGNGYTLVDVGDGGLGALREALASGQCVPVYVRGCSWRQKARSQWTRAVRQGGLKARLRGAAYYAVALWRDLRRGKR